jgi:ERCC4-related helicase
LMGVLKHCGVWLPARDAKLAELATLIQTSHRKEKVLVFTQFADTARYIKTQLTALGVTQIEDATGSSADPTSLAWRFSPESNKKLDRIAPGDALRVLIATDVLSEGQNLQDAHIVVSNLTRSSAIRSFRRTASSA